MPDLRIGGNYDGNSPQYDSTWTAKDVDGRDVPVLRVQAHNKGTTSTTGSAPAFGPNDTPEMMLEPIQRDIEKKRGMLAETRGFDPKTGQPIYLIEGNRRQIIERELLQLEHHTLPLMQLRAKEAAAFHARQPTREAGWEDELERRAAVQQRALSIADETEARREAEKILAARRPKF